jgi:hypothetical protein
MITLFSCCQKKPLKIMKKLLSFFCVIIPLFCFAQDNTPPNTLPREYEYDAAGNRTSRKILTMNYAPPAPQDSTIVIRDERDNRDHSAQTERWLSEAEITPDYFVETIAQTEIRIYPNPTTEKIALEIVGAAETRLIASLRLFTMTGQLLQNYPIHSNLTEVSLAGLARGAYILKVQINDRVEDWKIIKQ